MKERIRKVSKTVRKKVQTIDPVLGWIGVVTVFLLGIGLIATGVMNVVNSVAMRMDVPERTTLESEISRCRSELNNMEKNTPAVVDGAEVEDNTSVEVEVKDEELRDLEAQMAKVDNGSYARLKHGVIMGNLAWFVSGGIVLVVSIILARWVKQNVDKDTRKTKK